mgnify:CR=1 FL=1
MPNVWIENKTKVKINERTLARYAASALEAVKGWKDAELSIILVGDKRIQSLNARWRGKDRPTDVISFPMDGVAPPAPGETLVVGDIVIGIRRAIADAAEEGVLLDAKLRELVVHSVLHLMGHDHETDEQARAMETRRRSLLKAMERRA